MWYSKGERNRKREKEKERKQKEEQEKGGEYQMRVSMGVNCLTMWSEKALE